jgi:hypothetical protein
MRKRSGMTDSRRGNKIFPLLIKIDIIELLLNYIFYEKQY